MDKLIDLERITIKTTEQQREAAKFFADNSDIEEYEKRKQTNIPVIRKQIYEGKLSEFGVYNWKKSIGENVSEVDVKIYPKNEKSFAQDLMSDGSKIHVKSESADKGIENGTASFIFQYGNSTGSGGRDWHAFDQKSKDPVVFCVVDGDGVEIVARTYIHVLHQHNLFCQPRKTELYGIKRAVYLCDLFDMEKTINGNI